MTSTQRRSISEEKRERAPDLLIETLNRQRIYKIDRRSVAGLARKVLDRIGREDASLTIIFIRDREMRRLNRDFRGIDKSTDVLSFAYHESGEFSDPNHETERLGDVVISVETAAKYAKELGLSFDLEIDHLIIHGALHLAGYDHETDGGEMNRIERRLRRELLK